MIHHKVLSTGKLLSDVVVSLTNGTKDMALDLIQLGSVYVKPPSQISDEKTVDNNIKASRIINDVPVSENSYIRIHLDPRRFPLVDTVDWKSCILQDFPHFLAIDKPPGFPSHATVNNYTENVVYQVQKKALGLDTSKSLYLPQRLDTDTSGLMLLAKDVKTIAKINKALQAHKIKKFYRTLVAYRVDEEVWRYHRMAEGEGLFGGMFQANDLLTSYLKKTSGTSKTFVWDIPPPLQQLITSPESKDDEYLPCHLRFHEIKPPLLLQDLPQLVPLSSHLQHVVHTWQSNSNNHSNDISEKKKAVTVVQEVTVELLTGRTHQIRGQLQALQRHPDLLHYLSNNHNSSGVGVHVAGDNMYRGITSTPLLPPPHVNDPYSSSSFLALQVIRYYMI